MNLKHKVIKDFQYLGSDKKIFTLKAGTIIEEYIFKLKNEDIDIDKDIIDNNPEFFEIVDWKAELLLYLKSNKIPQPAVLSKKIIPFINDIIISIDKPQIKNDSSITERENRMRIKEEDFLLRTSRLERKEQEYMDDIAALKFREDSLREDLVKLSSKEIRLQEKLKEIEQKQRDHDIQLLECINDDGINERYKEMENNIIEKYKDISRKEKHIDEILLDINEYNSYLDQKLSEIFDWKETVLRNWNYSLYPIPTFPEIEKRFIIKKESN